MITNDEDNIQDGLDWDNSPIQSYKGLPLINKESDPRLLTCGDKFFIIVWNAKTETCIWWDLVIPMAKTIANSRHIAVVEIDTHFKPDPHNIFPIVSIDCSKLTRDRLKAFVRHEPDEPLVELLQGDKQNFLLYFHSIHETREKLHGLTSIVIDKIARHVIFSGVLGQSNLSNNILNPSNINKCGNIYFERCSETKTQ